MKMKAVTEDYKREIEEAKVLLGRLYKGQSILERAHKEHSIATAFQAINLFNELSKELYSKLELCLFIHEYLCMNKTVLIHRNGRGVNMTPYVEIGDMEIDPWTLQTIVALKDVFGDDFKNMITFENAEQENH